MTNIPFGYCKCGCGQKTHIAPYTHYKRGMVGGQPIAYIHGHNRRRDARERFWEKVDRRGPNECWNWTAGHGNYGYGTFTYKGHAHNASRVAYIFTFGEISGEVDVLHTCDNPPCCNPAHLFLGTALDNVHDMFAKHRNRNNAPKGSRVHGAKLKESDVLRIRELYSKWHMAQKDIARLYHVSQPTIGYLLRGETWKSV